MTRLVTVESRNGIDWRSFARMRPRFYHGTPSDGSDLAQRYEISGPHRHRDGLYSVLWYESGYSGVDPAAVTDQYGGGQMPHGGLSYHPSIEEAMAWCEAHNAMHTRRTSEPGLAEVLVALGDDPTHAAMAEEAANWNPDTDPTDPRNGAST